jgi:hypothetical protein
LGRENFKQRIAKEKENKLPREREITKSFWGERISSKE